MTVKDKAAAMFVAWIVGAHMHVSSFWSALPYTLHHQQQHCLTHCSWWAGFIFKAGRSRQALSYTLLCKACVCACF
jgi:hypothetical protein